MIREGLVYVDSHRDLHFTDSMPSGASEYETLFIDNRRVSGPALASPYETYGQQKFWIESVRLHTATNHAFTIVFYTREVKDQRLGATPYAASMVDYVEFAAADAFGIPGGTEWLYTQTNLKIPYMDQDGSGAIHCGLYNRSTSTKGALGATLPVGVTPQYIHLRVGLIPAA